MPKSFAQFLDTTTLVAEPNEEVIARKHFEAALGCIGDTVADIRKALTEPDVATQEVEVLKKLVMLSGFTHSALRVFYEYKDDQFDIVEEGEGMTAKDVHYLRKHAERANAGKIKKAS